MRGAVCSSVRLRVIFRAAAKSAIRSVIPQTPRRRVDDYGRRSRMSGAILGLVCTDATIPPNTGCRYGRSKTK